MSDISLLIRQKVVAWLKAGAPLGGVVVANIKGEERGANQVWPFIGYGLPSWENYEDSCGEGLTGQVVIDSFAYGPGTDAVHAVAAAVAARMAVFETSAFRLIECDFVRTSIIRDTAEASAYHAITVFRFTATAS